MFDSKLKRFVVVFAVLAVAGLLRMKGKSDAVKPAHEQALALLAEVDGYIHNKSTYDTFAMGAHDRAVERSYSDGGRSRGDSFDPDRYISCFFDEMIQSSIKFKTPHMEKSLREFVADRAIPLPTN